MRFGIQNSVMAWDDPWFETLSKKCMRMGEGQFFPSQDPMPSKKAFIEFLKKLNVDFLMQQIMPDDNSTAGFIKDMEDCGIGYMLGNEFGNINGPYEPGTNRYDVSANVIQLAKKTDRFYGLLYDETEHLQLHPNIYRKDGRYPQWLSKAEETEEKCEESFVRNVRQTVRKCGVDMYAECVFPALMHLLARGGMHLSPKVLKEEYQSIMFAVAMGACKQYKRKLSITVDLWGFDVGAWFTRLWGFPAHGVNEFYNALVCSWYMGPELLFVENCDPLAVSYGDSLELTEFGEVYRQFLSRYKNRVLPYSHRNVTCKIAVIHADNGIFSAYGTFDGGGSFGFCEFLPNAQKNSFFEVMHVLSHKKVSRYGTTFWNTDFQTFPTGAYARTKKNYKKLPLQNGVGKTEETSFHTLFYPLNGVLVFDDAVTKEALGEPELIIVCGDRCREETLRLVNEYAKRDTRVNIPEWLAGGNTKNCIIVNEFLSGDFEGLVDGYIGNEDRWNVCFGKYCIEMTNPSGDGNALEFNVREK